MKLISLILFAFIIMSILGCDQYKHITKVELCNGKIIDLSYTCDSKNISITNTWMKPIPDLMCGNNSTFIYRNVCNIVSDNVTKIEK